MGFSRLLGFPGIIVHFPRVVEESKTEHVNHNKDNYILKKVGSQILSKRIKTSEPLHRANELRERQWRRI